jgi:iron complex outermembrane receptor protein
MLSKNVTTVNRCRFVAVGAVHLLAAWSSLPAHAADSEEASTGLATVTVIGTTPVPGASIDADKVPSNVESVRASDLARGGTASLSRALNEQLGSININDTLADPFQPDIFYRGFDASPVLGTPQGLAVYQNGVRINEAFGDAVNWDLIPDIAISQVDIVSANPVYGLNALGGAATLTLKDGFNYQGGEVELSGGSFKQHSGTAQFGANNGQLGIYAAGRILDEDGWRLFAHDRIRQFYAAGSAHLDAARLDLTYTHADNQLFGPGAAPVQSLALDPRSVFTGPQGNLNRLDFLTLDGSYSFAKDLSAQGVLYYRNYRQSVSNGNRTNDTACTSAANGGFLCQSDGVTPLTNAAGQELPDISNGGTVPIGENDFENIHSQSVGGSLQLTGKQSVAGLDNQFAVGASVDTAHIDFSSGAQIGVIAPDLVVQPAGLFVATPEDTGFSATPVILKATNKYYGFFVTDTFDVTAALAVTASGRYNIAQIDLYDQRGTNLNGLNRYTHFNPAIGATYKLLPEVTAYAGYSTTNRAPTANEIECSDPLFPCLLPANLAGDPPNLRQVIAHTYEAGLRGYFTPGGAGRPDGAGGALTWNVGAFRTDLDDDIYAISTTLSTGFFQNVGSTRRQGGQAGLAYKWRRGDAYLNYSYVDATFQSAFTMSSHSNPVQDANGNIKVAPGDHLPGIPKQRIKLGGDYEALRDWTLGGTLTYVSTQFYKGDESNQNAPLPGYQVLNLHTAYQFWRRSEPGRPTCQLFLMVNNVFDRRFATYGIYSDPTGVGAPGIAPGANSNDPGVDNRFQNPAAPRSVFGGVRLTF